MFTPNFASESQEQWTETQRKFTGLWDDYQRQVMESQKKLLNSWTESFPKEMTQANFSESVEKTLALQQNLLNSTLEAQQSAINLAIETQKQLWNNYFQMTQKTVQQMSTQG